MARRQHTRVLALLASAAAIGLAVPATAGALNRPPRPLVVADGGAHRLAARGSYCWSGPRSAVCADYLDPMASAPILHAPAGSSLTMRMGYPVERVSVSADGERLRRGPLDARGRRFEVALPEGEPGETIDLYIQAAYEPGDGSFAIRVAPSE